MFKVYQNDAKRTSLLNVFLVNLLQISGYSLVCYRYPGVLSKSCSEVFFKIWKKILAMFFHRCLPENFNNFQKAILLYTCKQVLATAIIHLKAWKSSAKPWIYFNGAFLNEIIKNLLYCTLANDCFRRLYNVLNFMRRYENHRQSLEYISMVVF